MNWVTYAEARQQFGFHRSTLFKWTTAGIPALRGRKLPSKPERRLFKGRWPGGTKWTVPVFCKRTLRAAHASMLAQSKIIARDWGTARELANEFDCSPTRLEHWVRRGIPSLGGKKLPAMRAYRMNPSRSVRLLNRQVVAEAMMAMKEKPTAGSWARAADLAAEFDISLGVVYRWASDGIASLGMRKLPSRKMRVAVPGRRGKTEVRFVRMYDRSIVSQATKQQPRPDGALTIREAARRWHVAEHTVRRGLRDGRLKSVRSPSDLHRGKSFILYIVDPPVKFEPLDPSNNSPFKRKPGPTNGHATPVANNGHSASSSPLSVEGVRANNSSVFCKPHVPPKFQRFAELIAADDSATQISVARELFGEKAASAATRFRRYLTKKAIILPSR